MSNYQLAQLNVAALKAPIDSPELKDFVDNLDRINALADAAPGFVWRLMGDGNDATALRPLGEPIIVNMSVWRDVERAARLRLQIGPRGDHAAPARMVHAHGRCVHGPVVGARRARADRLPKPWRGSCCCANAGPRPRRSRSRKPTVRRMRKLPAQPFSFKDGCPA